MATHRWDAADSSDGRERRSRDGVGGTIVVARTTAIEGGQFEANSIERGRW
ncbi:hypothetical protein [Halovivax cerinus]|uniref:Uncharacterized protein n=1 Tax=Halovivax cerinus TaxID=1487865 RepID=A0ABD5NPW6_9EURY|nr:hypothetical protein [Halovivax cerinus]